MNLMTEHNIDNFMKLATNHNKDSDLTDNYYRARYEEIASGKKYSFNWCAFLFNGFWLLYRKMYVYGIAWLIFLCLYIAGVESVTMHVMGMTSSAGLKILFRIIFCIIQFIPGIFLGFIGNWLYVQQIHKKIDQGYHLSNARNIDKLTWSLAFISSMVFSFGFIIWAVGFKNISTPTTGYMQYVPTVLHVLLSSALGFVAVKRDEKKVKMALLAERALTEKCGEPSSRG